MKISDIFASFPSSARFAIMGHDPIDVRRYAGIAEDRWLAAIDSTGSFIGVGQVELGGAGVADTWPAFLKTIEPYLDRLDAGVVLLLNDFRELPVTALLTESERMGLQWISAVPLGCDVIKGALVAQRTKVPVSPSRWLTVSRSSSAPSLQQQRRLLSEATLVDAVRRAEQRDLRREWDRLGQLVEQEASLRVEDVRAGGRRELNAARNRYEQNLARVIDQMRDAEARFRTAKTSSAYRLGNLIGLSIRNPLWALWGFPRELWYILRDRRKRRSGVHAEPIHRVATAPRETVHEVTVKSTAEQSMLRFPAPSPQAHPMVAYVSAPWQGGLRRAAHQVDLQPNNCFDILESQVPNAICVDASAALAGSPWAGLGTAIDVRAARKLAELLLRSRQYGLPTIFRWDLPPWEAPMLIQFARQFDFVVASTDSVSEDSVTVVPHGVNLKVFGTLTGNADPESQLLVPVIGFAEDPTDQSWDPATDVLEKSDWKRTQLSARNLHDPLSLASAFQGAGLIIFPPFHELSLVVLEALSSGVPVVGGRDRRFSALSDPADIHWTIDAVSNLQALAAARRFETLTVIDKAFSTTAEVKALGRLVGSVDLQQIDAVMAILTAYTTAETEHGLKMLRATGSLLDSAVVEGNAPEANRLASLGASLGISTCISPPGRSLAEAIRSKAKESAWVWIADSRAVATEAESRLTGHLARRHAADREKVQQSVGDLFVPASQLAILPDDALSHVARLAARLLNHGRQADGGGVGD